MWKRIITALTVVGAVQSSEAQQAPATSADTARRAALYYIPPRFKDPELATVLAFIMPGAGQLYASSRVMGVGEFAIATLGAILITRGQTERNRDTGFAPKEIGISLFAAGWLIGLATAADDVRDYNDRVARDVRDGKYGHP